ncbi:MAG: sn-glycerol-3-phosphate ABC transporter ATP-binding protein UgpC [Leptolyngbyaceae cyanobacterium SL_1_1]|nr:sn-glycerol-3-phosphate ABC transporter ATP-binding protein UgpC [Leptolyngbyaceae cyanobacterium RM1_1_2]NJO10378.1 sn-glycerol-3-phosphate ABC transporter ATP-binding protein UgpC [Leptolyngbyaceae cyanobacterium SL_1_1]
MAKVALEGITHRFGNTTAVEEITFTVPDGEFWVLVGPSGCGKSTLLRTIAGLETATQGKIYIGDRLVNSIAARERDVAMVFQNYALYPHMSVAENLAFGLKMRQTPPPIRQQRVETVARSLNIFHLLNRLPHQLSGGQQQRVALGRAIARAPQAFLLDEPLSNLDAQLRDETRAELKQLHQRFGITTLYVTHDQTEAMTLADRIVVLDQGKIQQIGTPQAVYARPENLMVAAFLGSPPMNLLEAYFSAGQLKLEGQNFDCPPEIAQQVNLQADHFVRLGIRPEHIQLSQSAPHLQVIAEIIEPLGREILVRAVLPGRDRSDPQTLYFQVAPSLNLKPGDRLPVRLALKHLFLFDSATGVRTYPV